MKKIFAYFLPVFIFSFMLCGCGRDKVTEDDTVINTPVISPVITVSPSVSPSVKPSSSMIPEIEDGNVNDTDGIISENDNGTLNNSTTSSPKPEATIKP